MEQTSLQNQGPRGPSHVETRLRSPSSPRSIQERQPAIAPQAQANPHNKSQSFSPRIRHLCRKLPLTRAQSFRVAFHRPYAPGQPRCLEPALFHLDGPGNKILRPCPADFRVFCGNRRDTVSLRLAGSITPYPGILWCIPPKHRHKIGYNSFVMNTMRLTRLF